MQARLVLVVICILLSFNLNGQSRIDRNNISFVSKTSKLTKAIGWQLNSGTGKWQENQNVIDNRECPNYWISHVAQNFKWMQFATLVHQNKKYYVLLWERTGGQYKYPKIQEDWQEDIRTHFFILDSTQYAKIKSTVDSKGKEDAQFSSKLNGFMTSRYVLLGGEHLYTEENLLAKITNVLENGSYSEECLTINSQHVDGKDVVRFRLPENCLITKYSKDAYFEVGLEDFKLILTE